MAKYLELEAIIQQSIEKLDFVKVILLTNHSNIDHVKKFMSQKDPHDMFNCEFSSYRKRIEQYLENLDANKGLFEIILTNEEYFYCSDSNSLTEYQKIYIDIILLESLLNYKDKYLEDRIRLLRMTQGILPNLINSLVNFQHQVQSIQRQIKDVNKEKIDRLNELDLHISDIRTKVAFETVKNIRLKRYLDKSKEIKLNYFKEQYDQEYERIKDEIDKCLFEKEREYVAHERTQDIMKIYIENLSNMEREWDDKYRVSLDAIKEKLFDTKFNAQKTHDKLVRIKELYDKYKNEVDEYKILKKIDEEQERDLQAIRNSVEKISKWWKCISLSRKYYRKILINKKLQKKLKTKRYRQIL